MKGKLQGQSVSSSSHIVPLGAKEEVMPLSSAHDHHQFGISQNFKLELSTWLRSTIQDPATQVGFNFLLFRYHLIVPCSSGICAKASRPHPGQVASEMTAANGGEFPEADRGRVIIANDRIYRHKVFRVKYTTYDVRRGQDSINPRTNANVMVLAPQEQDSETNSQHPFWYARVLGIFHTNVYDCQASAADDRAKIHRLEFLWVRWYRVVYTRSKNRLAKLEFKPATDDDTFGFLDPAAVVRGSHLIPAFHHGITTADTLLGSSITREENKVNKDWRYYYVNR